MYRVILILGIQLFLLASVYSHPLIENLNRDHVSLSQGFIKTQPVEVGREILDQVRKNIESRLINLVSGEYPHTKRPIALYTKLLLKTWDQKVKQRRFYYFNQEILRLFGITEEYCSEAEEKKECFPVEAIYVPYIDAIMVRNNVDAKDLAPWLYHEIIHAFQYTYRLPIDLTLLGEIATGAVPGLKLPLDQMVDYLRFFYEAQAFYYSMRIFPDQDWIKAGKSDLQIITTNLVKFVGMAGLTFATLPFTFITADLLTSPLGKFLPVIDAKRQSSNMAIQDGQGGQLEVLSEMVFLRKPTFVINPSINLDFSWFVRLFHKIEFAYFGVVQFLDQAESEDQKIAKVLHDQYYKKILKFDIETDYLLTKTAKLLTESNDGKLLFYYKDFKYDLNDCQKVIDQVDNGVPFLEWFTLDSEKSTCPIYQDFLASDREKYLELITASNQKFYRDSKGFYNAGTEGGGGPALYIHPQLRIKP